MSSETTVAHEAKPASAERMAPAQQKYNGIVASPMSGRKGQLRDMRGLRTPRLLPDQLEAEASAARPKLVWRPLPMVARRTRPRVAREPQTAPAAPTVATGPSAKEEPALMAGWRLHPWPMTVIWISTTGLQLAIRQAEHPGRAGGGSCSAAHGGIDASCSSRGRAR